MSEASLATSFGHDEVESIFADVDVRLDANLFELREQHRHLGASDAHGEADICLFESGGVVGSVAGDGNDLAELLQAGDEGVLVLWA